MSNPGSNESVLDWVREFCVRTVTLELMLQGGAGFGKLDYVDTFGSGRLFSYSMNDM